MVGELMARGKEDILRNLFTERELERKLSRAQYELQKYLKRKDYLIAAFRALDTAHMYVLLQDTQEANHYYRTALEYLDNAKLQPLWVRLECLIVLGKHEEALNMASADPHYTALGLALLHEEIGNNDTARNLYREVAARESVKKESKTIFRPHFLQYLSDLWEKAQDTERARPLNEKAVQMWEETRDTRYDSLAPIEKAWLYEEIGYIYQKAAQVEAAMDYYQKAKTMYRKAYLEDPTATGAHQVDGDWASYEQWFHIQLPELNMIDFGFERSWKLDSKRIKYRILILQEKMRHEADPQ
jgi:tetratricopeptide (TPR) repeat protein